MDCPIVSCSRKGDELKGGLIDFTRDWISVTSALTESRIYLVYLGSDDRSFNTFCFARCELGSKYNFFFYFHSSLLHAKRNEVKVFIGFLLRVTEFHLKIKFWINCSTRPTEHESWVINLGIIYTNIGAICILWSHVDLTQSKIYQIGNLWHRLILVTG